MNAVTVGLLVPLVSASPLRFAPLAGTTMVAGLLCYLMLRAVTKNEGGYRDSVPAYWSFQDFRGSDEERNYATDDLAFLRSRSIAR